MEGEGLSNTSLVYELASNGSLDIFWKSNLGRERRSSAKVRTRIALEVATVLRYMHEGEMCVELQKISKLGSPNTLNIASKNLSTLKALM